jgi:nitroreductase
MSDSLMSGLRSRRAVKRFETIDNLPIPVDSTLVSNILEAISLAPSSSGITPYKVYVVTNAELKSRIFEAAYNQKQMIEASHLLFFAASTDSVRMTARYIAANNLEEKNPGYAAMIKGGVGKMSSAEFTAWAKCQAYIALGVAVATAADLRYNAVLVL